MHSSDSDSDPEWNKKLIDAVRDKYKNTITSEQVRMTEMKKLLNEGADINTVDKNGNTPLHTAVKRGYQKIVEFLRENGARTDIPNRKGETPITLAENLGQQEIASISREPSTSRENNMSIDDSSLNSSSTRSNRKRTADAVDGNLNESLGKMRSIGVPQPDLRSNATAVEQKSNRKRTADDELGEHAKRLQKLTSTDVSQPDIYRSTAKDETYAASGLKRSLHGTVYQLKLLMLSLHRAWKNGYSFCLATEMDAAEKFDDVVLRYRDNNGDEVYRFVQAKHKQDETKMISVSDLLDVKDGDFSLLKYFISWRKIKKNPDFRGGRSKNFILCTNIGLEVDSLKEENINVSDIKEPDVFLMVTNRPSQPPRYKLLVENQSDLWDTLKSASAVHRLAKELAERVCDSENIHLNTEMIKSYHVALAVEVVNVREKKFFANFIDDKCLSAEAAEFRKILFQNTKRLPSKRNLSDDDIWIFLRESSLKLSSTFGKKTQSVIISEQTQSIKLPNDQIEDAEISRFLDEFILAVNQPNEVELGEMMKREIGIHGQLDLPDAGFVRDSFQIEILNWFKTKQGSFLQNKDAADFFNEMKVKLGSLKTMALSLEYSEKLKKLGIRFNCENTELQNFISCSDHTPNQVLEMISPKQTLLTALQVCQTLAQLREREENEGFIFVRLKTLLTPEIMKLVLPAFKWPRHNNLLVVDCESISAKQHLQRLWNPLCDILAEDVHKKMIVITQSGKDLGTECTFSRKTNCRVKDTDHSFDKLTNDSRKKLLEKQVTKFQGRNNEIRFGELLGVRDVDNLEEDELKDLSDIMDSETLVKLVSDEEIHLGRDLDGLDDIQAYYISRTIFQRVFIKEDIFKNKRIPDLLAIGGIDQALLCKLVQMGEASPTTQDMLMRSVGTSVAQGTTNLISLDSDREEEQFNALCAGNEGRNVHLLTQLQGKYIWKKSQGDITHLVQHRGDRGTDDNYNSWTGVTYLTENQLTAHDAPVIISDTAGTGKSTMLTYVASKIKEDKPDMLVLRINLNHHATALAEVGKKSTYDLDTINRAVQFLIEKVLSRETNLTQKVFERIIRRKHKVALIFDGFDEISPTYEGPVIDLLETFANYGIKKLLVATRPHTRATLETKLNTFSYEIQPFVAYDQNEFLIKFWKAKFQDSHYDSQEIAEDRIRKYTTAIMIKLADSIKDQRNKFTGIPLQAKLVAEIFEDHSEGTRDFDSCKEFTLSEANEPRFPEKINLIYLYEKLVEKKFDVFFEKRGGNLADVAVMADRRQRYKSFIANHQRLALDTLFDKDKIKELLPSRQDASGRSPEPADLDIPIERDGIITQSIDGQARFGHRTYAEYFAANFFSDMLKRRHQTEPLGKIIVADILLRENFDTMRAFMDCLLPDEHVDVLQGAFWALCLKTHRSQRQETIFHVAAAEGNGRITRLFLNCFDENTEDRRDLLQVKDILGRTAVHQAVTYGNLDKIKLLIEDTDVEIDSRDNSGSAPLHEAAHTTNIDVVKYLIRRGANINCQTNDGVTPLHLATLAGRLDLVEYLHANGADIFCKLNNGVTLLHMAVQTGKRNVIEYLHRNGVKIDCQKDDGWTSLHLAVWEGKLEVVEDLHRNGANINCRTNNGRTSLHVAALSGKLDVVEYLHGNGADVNWQANDGATPLHLAVKEGQLDVVRYLHRNGADISRQTENGQTSLHLAAWRGELDMVKYLHGNGADINCQAHGGRTSLHEAVLSGKLDIVQYLDRNGADINRQTMFGETPLHLAAWRCELDMVRCLYGNGADVNRQMNDGRTSLYVTAQRGKLDIVEYLHRNGADITLRNNDGRTSLWAAALTDRLDVVGYLHENGADINAKENDGTTPLHQAILRGKLDTVKYLHRNGADINHQTKDGWTSLHMAAQGRKLEAVQYLHQNGADINCQMNDGWTPLHLAARGGKLDVVQYLHQNGADISCQTTDGWTPLHLAAREGELDVVQYLHQNGADINCQMNDGWAPLHLAAREGKLDVVQYLHRNGADISCQTTDGRTSLHVATQGDKPDVIEYLQRNGAEPMSIVERTMA